MNVTIYHNPRCSKSRATLALLRERGIEPQVIEYLKTPPTRDDLLTLLERLGEAPMTLVRHTDPGFAQTALDPENAGANAVASALAAHPALLQRPVVVVGERARIGRPPERVLELL